MERRRDPIKRIELADGSVRYRFVVDVGTKVKVDKVTGKPLLDGDGGPALGRDQRTHTFGSLREAKAERTVSALARGALRLARGRALTAPRTGVRFPARRIKVGDGC